MGVHEGQLIDSTLHNCDRALQLDFASVCVQLLRAVKPTVQTYCNRNIIIIIIKSPLKTSAAR
jgi:hypothetical protein